MYFSWKPWQSQRSLSIDDKLGLSSIYPAIGNECGVALDCPTTERCTQHAMGRLCQGPPDPVGAICNYDRVECDAFCLFTALDLSSGCCSKFCDTDLDCPLTHHWACTFECRGDACDDRGRCVAARGGACQAGGDGRRDLDARTRDHGGGFAPVFANHLSTAAIALR